MKYTPSIAFEAFSGSAGTVTASRFKNRQYIMNKPIPTNPRTKYQTDIRTMLANAVSAFKKLSESDKKKYDSLAKTAFGKSVLGSKTELTGYNLFMRLKMNLQLIGISYNPRIYSAQVTYPVITNVSVAYDPEGSSYQLTISLDSLSVQSRVLWKTTNSLDTNPSLGWQDLRIVGFSSTVTSATGTLTAIFGNSLADRWSAGDPSTAPTIFLSEITLVDVMSGATSEPYRWRNETIM